MSTEIEFKTTGTDAEEILVETPCYTSDRDVAFLQISSADGDATSAYLTREAAIGIIQALTDLLKAHDDAEAEKAAAEAREAAKLKRGDIVYLKYDPSARRTVIVDETEDGHVDLVTLTSEYGHAGVIQYRKDADQYARA